MASVFVEVAKNINLIKEIKEILRYCRRYSNMIKPQIVFTYANGITHHGAKRL
jgi:hypothetical protein